MPTKADDRKPESVDTEPAVSAVFELLSHHRRRISIQYLATQTGTTSVSDLADQIALLEGEHTHEHYERICTSLVHNHLPKLTDAGIVEYDQEREVVDLRDRATDVLPYLDLAASAD
ncbi:DUF7344 domain-containing protein [Natronomonas marina]|jgi:DNA-binding transcriptional ArsR family regulator|uniref:DUF7344 domain-containing protein n=1 Tax=Natronomonas marina TaxID=2961939 RepID=UPI003D9C7CD6